MIKRVVVALCIFTLVCGTYEPYSEAQVPGLSFVETGVATSVALNKADAVGTHLIQQAGQVSSLTSSKVARDLQLLIDNARQQMNDELNTQWDKLDSQKLSVLRE